MRKELADIVNQFFNQKFSLNDVKLPTEIKNMLILLADIVAKCRTSVSRDPYRKNILTYIPEYEIGTRLGIQFSKLGVSLAAIRGKKEIEREEFEILKRIAVDTIPKKAKVLIQSLSGKGRLSTSEIVEDTGMEGETCRSALLDLAVLRLVDREEIQGRGNPIGWKLIKDIQNLIDKLGIF